MLFLCYFLCVSKKQYFLSSLFFYEEEEQKKENSAKTKALFRTLLEQNVHLLLCTFILFSYTYVSTPPRTYGKIVCNFTDGCCYFCE